MGAGRHRVPEPLREPPQRRVGGDVGRDHAELLAAPPGHEVVRAGRRLEPAADLGQDPVAREMPVAVVERLEPVDVGHHQAERDLVALGARQLDLVHVEHVVPVREARQGVRPAAVLRLFGGPLDVGDVGQDAVHEQPPVGGALGHQLLPHVPRLAARDDAVDVVDGGQGGEPLVPRRGGDGVAVVRVHDRPPEPRGRGRGRPWQQAGEPIEPRALEFQRRAGRRDARRA